METASLLRGMQADSQGELQTIPNVQKVAGLVLCRVESVLPRGGEYEEEE